MTFDISHSLVSPTVVGALRVCLKFQMKSSPASVAGAIAQGLVQRNNEASIVASALRSLVEISQGQSYCYCAWLLDSAVWISPSNQAFSDIELRE